MMIQQLRIYEIFEHNKAAFHERFRDHAARIMRTYGFEIIAMWEAQTDTRTEFVYLLACPDAPTMRSAWDRFRADEEWKEIKRFTSAQHESTLAERKFALRDASPSVLSPVLAKLPNPQ